MTEKEFFIKLKKHQENNYTIDINTKDVLNSDLLEILIKRFEDLNYSQWITDGKIKSNLDIRFQLMLRIETASIHYYQSIKSTIRDVEYIWKDTKNLGYLDNYVMGSLASREVSLRTSYLENIFFAIDYFIQQMNNSISFHESGSIHKKHQFFKMLMEKLKIEDETININDIIRDLNNCIIKPDLKNLFIEGKDREVQLFEIYTYLVAYRNIFHNNGYSQKTLNRINIGGVLLNVKKDTQISISHDVIITVVFMIVYPLVKIIEATFSEYPDMIWEDRYTKELKEDLAERLEKRNANNV